MAHILWEPTEERKKNANITKFIEYVNRKYGKNFKTYDELYGWSIESVADFWGSVWEFCGVKASKKYSSVVIDPQSFDKAKWFVGAELNFAENLLRWRDDQIAFTYVKEGLTGKRTTTYKDLYKEVAKLANAYKEEGIERKDRIVAYIPNVIEAAVGMLAASTVGAIWASCGPELGPDAVIDRFKELEPKILITADAYIYKGQAYDLLKNVEIIAKNIPSLKKVVIVRYLERSPNIGSIYNAILYDEFVEGKAEETDFEQLPSDHPHIILFSSGVTGKPKCIVHSLSGSLIAHLKTHILHFDIKRDDKVLFLSSPTWMVWNLKISSLATGCNIVLYDGNPFYPDFDVIFRLIMEEKITCLGCGAAFILSLMRSGVRPKSRYDLSSLKTIFQTAAPLPQEGFEYVYSSIKEDVCLLSGLGGTDVQCGIIEGSPIQPVYKGEMPSGALGFAVKVYDEKGRPVLDEPGELVVEKPFPSTPLYFWGDDTKKKYKETYFSLFPNVWRHGDFAVQKSETGTFIGLGRSDFVLKPKGVRIGPAEIYNVVERIEEIEDSLVVGQSFKGDQRIILFVKLKRGYELTDELKAKIKNELKLRASARHVPEMILEVPEIPYTVNMKKVESVVHNIVNGRPITNRQTLINPDCLEYYEKLYLEKLKE
ncbi:MAG: acetoacetate--CoA ligase [Desulfobacterota bacterium]|nr:acetoacetate--CoA ligase [Thermodesulfobacteriota bacterium]MDW8001866.1 acetoacetate--CoA ligase [Deltaproteobacteria bacterium]